MHVCTRPHLGRKRGVGVVGVHGVCGVVCIHLQQHRGVLQVVEKLIAHRHLNLHQSDQSSQAVSMCVGKRCSTKAYFLGVVEHNGLGGKVVHLSGGEGRALL